MMVSQREETIRAMIDSGVNLKNFITLLSRRDELEATTKFGISGTI